MVISWPAAVAASTRHEQVSTPSINTAHELHSPSVQAFLVPVSPRRSRSTNKRLSARSESATSQSAPFTRSE